MILQEYFLLQRRIYGVLRDLVPFIQFKKREKHPWRNVNFSRLKPATLLKLTLLHGCFSCFLNCANDIKSRNASHLRPCKLSMAKILAKIVRAQNFFEKLTFLTP